MEPDNAQSDNQTNSDLLELKLPDETNTENNNNNVSNGVQKRIDELTAKIHKRDEQIEALLAKQNDIAQQAMQAMQRPVHVQMPQAPVVEETLADDATPAQMAAYFAKQQSKMMEAMSRRIESAVGNVAARQYQNEAQQALASQDPIVRQEAQTVMSYWQREGKQGWEPIDAIRYAKGILIEQGKWSPKTGATGNGGTRSNAHTMLTQPSGQPEPTGNNEEFMDAARIKDPADLHNWPLQKQLEYQELKLRKTGQNSF